RSSDLKGAIARFADVADRCLPPHVRVDALRAPQRCTSHQRTARTLWRCARVPAALQEPSQGARRRRFLEDFAREEIGGLFLRAASFLAARSSIERPETAARISFNKLTGG